MDKAGGQSTVNFVGASNFRQPANIITSAPSSSKSSKANSPTASPTKTPSSPTARRSRRSSAASANQRLSIIEEDKPHQSQRKTPSPTLQRGRTHHRPWSRRFLPEPPQYSTDHDPPTYSFVDAGSTTGLRSEKLYELKNKKFVAERGGCRRIFLLIFLIFLCLVGLIVGLAVGLTRRHHHDG